MMMRKSIAALLLAFFLILAAVPLASARRKKGSHPELCEIKTVAVTGNSESASIVRREIEKRTWLKLAASGDKADAVLDIAETKSTRGFPMTQERTTVSGNLTRKDAIVWSDSSTFGEGPFNSGAGSAVKILLAYLKDDAGGCQVKPKTTPVVAFRIASRRRNLKRQTPAPALF